jgi:hypothetical protein
MSDKASQSFFLSGGEVLGWFMGFSMCLATMKSSSEGLSWNIEMTCS